MVLHDTSAPNRWCKFTRNTFWEKFHHDPLILQLDFFQVMWMKKWDQQTSKSNQKPFGYMQIRIFAQICTRSRTFLDMKETIGWFNGRMRHWTSWLLVSIEAPCSGPVQVGFAGRGWFLKKVVSGWLDGHFTLNHDGWMGKSSVFVGFVDCFCVQSSSADE